MLTRVIWYNTRTMCLTVRNLIMSFTISHLYLNYQCLMKLAPLFCRFTCKNLSWKPKKVMTKQRDKFSQIIMILYDLNKCLETSIFNFDLFNWLWHFWLSADSKLHLTFSFYLFFDATPMTLRRLLPARSRNPFLYNLLCNVMYITYITKFIKILL